MSNISESTLENDPVFKRRLEEAFDNIVKHGGSGQDIQAEASRLRNERLVELGTHSRDPFNPDILIEQAAPESSNRNRVERSVTIDGTVYTLVGETESDVQEKQDELIQKLVSGTPPATRTPDVTEELTRTPDSVFDGYLKSLGVDPNEIRDRNFQQSWSDAVQTYLNSPEGKDWPGGDANKEKMAQLLAENNLVDAEDKVAAIAAVAKYLRENDLLVANPAVEAHHEMASALTVDEIRAAARKSVGLSPTYGTRDISEIWR